MNVAWNWKGADMEPRRKDEARGARLLVVTIVVALILGWAVLVLLGAGPVDSVPDVRGMLGPW